MVRCDRVRRKGGGVAVLLRKVISYSVILKQSVPDSFEILCCDLALHDQFCRVVVVYRKPGCSHSQTEEILNILGDLSTCSYPVVAVGDFNMPDIDWRNDKDLCTNSISQRFLDFCSSHSMTQLVTTPTRHNSVLDLVLVNRPHIVSELKTMPNLGMSDHLSVSFRLRLPKLVEPIKLRKMFSKADYASINSYLANVDWYGSFQACTAVNEMYELFIFVPSQAIQAFVPLLPTTNSTGALPSYLISLSLKLAHVLGRRQ